MRHWCCNHILTFLKGGDKRSRCSDWISPTFLLEINIEISQAALENVLPCDVGFSACWRCYRWRLKEGRGGHQCSILCFFLTAECEFPFAKTQKISFNEAWGSVWAAFLPLIMTNNIPLQLLFITNHRSGCSPKQQTSTVRIWRTHHSQCQWVVRLMLT